VFIQSPRPAAAAEAAGAPQENIFPVVVVAAALALQTKNACTHSTFVGWLGGGARCILCRSPLNQMLGRRAHSRAPRMCVYKKTNLNSTCCSLNSLLAAAGKTPRRFPTLQVG